MEENKKSKSWRAMGDSMAFDHGSWEFRARHFAFSAKRMKELSSQALDPYNNDALLIAPSEFMISLAIELIAKAHYLKHNLGPRERIYTHDVSALRIEDFLNVKEKEILRHSEQYVIWAGRYPTPKWTKEEFKANFDVPVKFVDGMEQIDASKLPNSACPNRIEEKFSLYHRIHDLWSTNQNDVQPDGIDQDRGCASI